MTSDLSDYEHEQQYAELFDEFANQVREEIKAERLQSYFLSHPDVVVPARWALNEARRLLAADFPSAAALLARTSLEVAMKQGMARAIVHGSVHDRSLADHVTELVVGGGGRKAYTGLLRTICRQYAEIDITTFKRPGSESPLQDEIQAGQAVRDSIVHQGKGCTVEEARRGVAIASTVFEHLLATVISRCGLELQPDGRVVLAFGMKDLAAMDRTDRAISSVEASGGTTGAVSSS